MEDKTIAGLTDKEIFILESGDINKSQRIEIESKLASYLNKNPRDLSALMLASGVTSDPFMRNYYVMSLVDIARKEKDKQAYALGIVASRLNNRGDIADELYLQMKEKYPIKARVVNLLSKVLCEKYKENSSSHDSFPNSSGKFS